jgi:hypothetical protein
MGHRHLFLGPHEQGTEQQGIGRIGDHRDVGPKGPMGRAPMPPMPLQCVTALAEVNGGAALART